MRIVGPSYKIFKDFEILSYTVKQLEMRYNNPGCEARILPHERYRAFFVLIETENKVSRERRKSMGSEVRKRW